MKHPTFFKTCEYDVKVKSSLLAEALNAFDG